MQWRHFQGEFIVNLCRNFAFILIISVRAENTVAVALHSAADERRQHWMEARDWYQKSLDSWRQISNPGAVSPDGWPCGNSREVANAVAICDRVRTAAT